jgi:hypothetical protein
VRAAWAESERQTEVRDAALSWARVGAIDAGALARIEELTPNAYRRVGPIFRALVFFFLSAAVLMFFAFWMAVNGSGTRALGLSSLFFAVALAVATELQLGSRAISAYGGAGALSFWAGVFALIGAYWALHEMDPSEATNITGCLAVSTLVWTLACWRWGVALFGLFSAVSFFLFLARLPQGRSLWLIAGLSLAWVGARRLDRVALAPPHRRAFGWLLCASLAAAYVAVNRYAWDRRIIEELRDHGTSRGGSGELDVLFAVLTALLPLGVLAWGVRSRRTLVLDIGLVLGALSLVTLRFYVHIAPLWVVLVSSGALSALAALAIQRVLMSSEGQELHGFTAKQLFRDESKNLQAAAVVLAFTPSARADAAPTERTSEFRGGGGDGGGGGASDSF